MSLSWRRGSQASTVKLSGEQVFPGGGGVLNPCLIERLMQVYMCVEAGRERDSGWITRCGGEGKGRGPRTLLKMVTPGLSLSCKFALTKGI